ncbi:MAG: prolyl oligopeptidase family serine peptidase [Pseudomonadota bacterium]
MISSLSRSLAALLAIGLCCARPQSAAACGPETDCTVGDRTYRLSLPEGHDPAAPIGALFYAHGYKGSAAGAMRNAALRETAHARGLAFVALKSAGDDWSLPHAPNVGPTPPEDEPAYVDAVIADLAGRIALDRARLLATGFSAGGMMTWTLACERPETFRGFIPVAGTFWAPVPDRCAGSVPSLVHIHGTTDRIVPLEGRRIADTRQGSVDAALSMFAANHGFRRTGETEEAGLACTVSVAGDAADELLFCTHPGGHSLRTEHLAFALGRLLGPARSPKD